MFCGIIEATGIVTAMEKQQSNLHLVVQCPFVSELKIDQSIAHNGVCLTVVKISGDTYTVTAIEETLHKTNLGLLQKGDEINLERSMRLSDRIDGHIVQGHVDQTGLCTSIEFRDGSWIYTFTYDAFTKNITVEKGSVCVNGVSLTVVNSQEGKFSVAIIPYTYEHTNFHAVKNGDVVNLEFDVIGKYVARYYEAYHQHLPGSR